MTTGRRVARGLLRAAAVLLVLTVLAVVGILFWANLVMRGDRAAAIDAWTDPGISIVSTENSIVMTPTGEATGAGLVYIPGARVDPYAYMYVLSGAVADGLTVVITKPTLNLAFFDQRPLSAFTSGIDSVDRWAVGGHSLGGVRACQLAEESDVAALVLFGSYCANDLAGSGLPVLSITGSEDGLSTAQKIADAAPLLPPDALFVEIEGLNHAGFGSYGPQSGDGEATLTRGEVRDEIAALLGEFLGD